MVWAKRAPPRSWPVTDIGEYFSMSFASSQMVRRSRSSMPARPKQGGRFLLMAGSPTDLSRSNYLGGSIIWRFEGSGVLGMSRQPEGGSPLCSLMEVKHE
jgi:hypothetical protein